MPNSTMSLYQVGVEGAELNDILSANDGELNPELELLLDEFLKSGKSKIDAACMVVKSIKASEEALAAEVQRLEKRYDAFVSDRKRLEDRILGAIDAAFDGKVKTSLFTVWGQTSADTIAVDVAPDCDLKALHEADPELVKVSYALDKKKCHQIIKDGASIGGVKVTENPGKRHLRIK